MKSRPTDYATPSLFGLGALGLVCSGLGALPHQAAWVWLVVLGMSVFSRFVVARAGARRFDASERRRNREAREEMHRARLDAGRDMDRMASELREMRSLVGGMLTPAQGAALVQDHNAMVEDMGELKRVVAELTQDKERQRLAGLVGGPQE